MRSCRGVLRIGRCYVAGDRRREAHLCAGRHVVCRGWNANGRLDDGSTAIRTPVPETTFVTMPESQSASACRIMRAEATQARHHAYVSAGGGSVPGNGTGYSSLARSSHLVTFVMRAQARADAAACQRQPGGYGHAGMAMAGHIHGARLRQTHRAPTTATRRDARSEGNDPAGMSPVWRARYAQHHAGAVCVGWRRPRASCSALGIPRSQMGRTGPDAPSRAGLSCTFGHEADEA